MKVDCSWKARPPPPPKHLCGEQPLMGYQEDTAKKCALPKNWKPCQNSGDTLKQYLACCEKKHNQAISQLYKDAAGVNHDVETQIRLAARIYNAEVEDIQRELEKSMSSKQKSIDDMLPDIEKAWKRRCDEVEDLHKELLRLEGSRADQLAVLLRSARRGMLDAALKTPNEIDLICDEDFYSVNNQQLCNEVGIAETRCHLLMLAGQAALDAQRQLTLARLLAEEESEKLKNDPTKELPSSREPIKRRSPGLVTMTKKDSTAALVLAAAFMSSQEAVRREALKISSFTGVDTGSSLDVIPVSVCNISTKDDICDHEGSIKEYVQSMLEVYREVVTKMFTATFNNLSKLRDDIASNHPISLGQYRIRDKSLTDLEKELDESMKIKIGLSFDRINNIHSSCRDNMTMLERMLQGVDMLMHDAVNLWTAHKRRTRCSRKLTVLALQRSVATHDAEQLASEMSLNVAIEQLRQSPDLAACEKYFLQVNTLLDTIGTMYEAHYNQELEQLWRYMELVQIASPLLCAEVDAFFVKYPDLEYKQKVAVLEKSWLRSILRPMEVNIAALLNSQLGLLSSIREKRSFMVEDLRETAIKWIQENAVTLGSKHNLKLRLHRYRYERIKLDIAEVRRYELEYHSARLTSHVNSVKQLVNSSDMPLREALKIENLYPIADRLQPIVDALADGQLKKETLQSMKLRVLSYSKSFEESVVKVRASWIKEAFDRLQKALDSTYAFLSSIRLFSSGGSWALLESERAARELARCAEMLALSQAQLEVSGEPLVALALLEPRHDVAGAMFGITTGLTAYQNAASINHATQQRKKKSEKTKF